MKNNQNFAKMSQNIICEGTASFLFWLSVHNTWQSLSSFSDSNFFEGQNQKSSFHYEYTIFVVYFEANSNSKMIKRFKFIQDYLWSNIILSEKIYDIVLKCHDDVMPIGNHQKCHQWPRFSIWETFFMQNIHKLSIYEIFVKRHDDVMPTGNDQNRVQWTRLSIRIKLQQIWFKFSNNGVSLRESLRGILKGYP